jgi:NADH:ubiquinone reductase (H+-translocating)
MSMSPGPPSNPHVVIVGGGFGGLQAAQTLGRSSSVRVTLVDRRNHHLFQPLLYQVATAALNPSDIAEPIRSILRRHRNVTVLLGDAERIDPAGKRIWLVDGESLEYDFLILATGATHSYFGNDAWAAHAPGLKTIEDALEIRRRTFLAYEAAEREHHEAHRQAWMTFVVIGAGPTGVEMAGALAEIARHALARDFRHIDPRRARVILIEGMDRVLPGYTPELSQRAARQLERLGVEIRAGVRVTKVDEEGVEMGAQRLAARTVIWAAGVQASPLAQSLGVPLDRAGRVRVGADLLVPSRDDVFVVGDLAALEQDGRIVPGVSPAALQEGAYVARRILRTVAGKSVSPFRYEHRGSFATIGRGAAVGEIGNRIQLSGLPAWLGWLVIHLYFLIGFRHRVFVLLQWAYSYVTYRRGARLITGPAVPFPAGDPPTP